MQDLALGFIEPNEVHMSPLLELVQVPLNGILSLTVFLGHQAGNVASSILFTWEVAAE